MSNRPPRYEVVVGVVTRLRVRTPRNGDSIPLKGTGFSFSPKRPYSLWGSATLLLNEDAVPTLKLKLLGHETEQSSPCKTEFKNELRYFSTSYVFVARIGTILPCLFTSYKTVFVKQIIKFSNISRSASTAWQRVFL